MSDDTKRVAEVRLLLRSDVTDAPKLDAALNKSESAANKTAAALKQVERQARAADAAIGKLASTNDLAKVLSSNPALAKLNPGLVSQAEQLGPHLPSVADRNAAIAEANAKRNADRKHFTDAEAAAEAGINLPTGFLSKGMLGAIGAVTAAAAGLAAVVKKSVDEYARAEDSVAGLNVALAQNGALTEQTSKNYQQLAASLSQATAIPTQNWVDVLTHLTQFGANDSNIKDATEAVKNLAGVLGGDIQQASHLMGRALAGDFEQLHRYGIQVNEGASQTEKLNSVMAQAAKLGGGQMEARAATLSGQMKNLKLATANVFEAFGGMIARTGALQFLFKRAEQELTSLANRMGGTIPIAGNLNNALGTSSRRLAEVQANAAAAAREFNSIEAQSRRATEAMNRQATAAQTLLRAQDEIANAELDLQIAGINAQEHGGQISPQQAELARAAARRQSEVAQLQRHQALDAETISASQRRLNQMFAQRGSLETEQGSARAEMDRQQQGHAARSDLNNAELAYQRAQQAVQDLQGAGRTPFIMRGAEGGAELARLEQQRAAELNTAHDQLMAARSRAEQFSNTSDQSLATATERFATASEDLARVAAQIREHQGQLEDAISNARLSRDTSGIRFGIDQRREAIELRDHLFQTPAGADATAVRSILREPNQADLIQQLREALLLRSEVTTAGFRDLITAINADIRVIQTQLRTLSTRR